MSMSLNHSPKQSLQDTDSLRNKTPQPGKRRDPSTIVSKDNISMIRASNHPEHPRNCMTTI